MTAVDGSQGEAGGEVAIDGISVTPPWRSDF